MDINTDMLFPFVVFMILSFPFIISLYNRTKIQQKYINNGLHTKGVIISRKSRNNYLTSLFLGDDIEIIEFEIDQNGSKRVIRGEPKYSDLTWGDIRFSGDTVDVYYLSDSPHSFIAPSSSGIFQYWTSREVSKNFLAIVLIIAQLVFAYDILVR